MLPHQLKCLCLWVQLHNLSDSSPPFFFFPFGNSVVVSERDHIWKHLALSWHKRAAQKNGCYENDILNTDLNS